eukprot:gene5979-55876_t
MDLFLLADAGSGFCYATRNLCIAYMGFLQGSTARIV